MVGASARVDRVAERPRLRSPCSRGKTMGDSCSIAGDGADSGGSSAATGSMCLGTIF